MTYVASPERSGFERGLISGLLTSLDVLLDYKFSGEGIALMPMLREIGDPVRLEAILYSIKTATSPDDIRALIEQGE